MEVCGNTGKNRGILLGIPGCFCEKQNMARRIILLQDRGKKDKI